MQEAMLSYLQYFLLSLWYTLGATVICGLLAHLTRRLFVALVGSGSFLYVTSVIGTPIHELGHAIMCIPFGHKITDMKLLLPPGDPSGTLGYVEHSYAKNNLWARLGNLFIGIGPILSGLGVIALCLFLCFPDAWGAYLAATDALSASTALPSLLSASLSLLLSLPEAFLREDWWIPLLGITVILFVSQHVSLSGADVKGSLSALPLYLLLLLAVTLPTFLLGVDGTVLGALFRFHLWTLTFFTLTVTFSLLWVGIGLILRLLRTLFRAF